MQEQAYINIISVMITLKKRVDILNVWPLHLGLKYFISEITYFAVISKYDSTDVLFKISCKIIICIGKLGCKCKFHNILINHIQHIQKMEKKVECSFKMIWI